MSTAISIPAPVRGIGLDERQLDLRSALQGYLHNPRDQFLGHFRFTEPIERWPQQLRDEIGSLLTCGIEPVSPVVYVLELVKPFCPPRPFAPQPVTIADALQQGPRPQCSYSAYWAVAAEDRNFIVCRRQ